MSKTYVWSGDGSQETIWDWLDAVNTEGGTGYAGRHDWRIPNQRELQSLVDYGRLNPAIDPIFAPIAAFILDSYWSSTTGADFLTEAWGTDFFNSADGFLVKNTAHAVRAVRGGRK